MTVLTGVSSYRFSMSTFLTWFLKEASVAELLISIFSLDHITGLIYLILFPIDGGIYFLGSILPHFEHLPRRH